MAENILGLSIADGDVCPVITLSGQADITTAGRLGEFLTGQLSRGTAWLVVDVAELSFADSMAIRTLTLAALTLNDRGGGLVLRGLQQPVARVLSLTGADQVMTIDEESGYP